MNPFEFVLGIVFVVTIGSILKARYGVGPHRRETRHDREAPIDGEKEMMRAEMRELKERVAVLERIVTDRRLELSDEIERLRDTRIG
jgi:hypothetical protein